MIYFRGYGDESPKKIFDKEVNVMMSPKIRLTLLLHFYQPWWQFPGTLATVVERCYMPIFKWLSRHQGFAFSANISWSLLELLEKNGYDELIALMRDAVETEKIELLGTDAYHSILPCITDIHIARQIAKDREGKRSVGLPPHTVPGFYLPEYAYERRILYPLQCAGYKFTVADDALFAAQHGKVPFDWIPTVDDFRVFLRSRNWGNIVSYQDQNFNAFRKDFEENVAKWFGEKTGYVVIATDAETFGYHWENLIRWLLVPMVENWRAGSRVELCPFSELARSFPAREATVPPGSWSTETSDAAKGDWFPLWNSRFNIFHEKLWRLVNLALEFADDPVVRCDALKTTSSCQWWWVSGRNGNWKPEFMMLGAYKALEIVERAGNENAKAEARHIITDIKRILHI